MLTQKFKAKVQVSLAKPGVPGWRPALGAAEPPLAHRPPLRRGYPVLSEAKSELGSKTVSGQRKYRPPRPPVVAKERGLDVDLGNCHSMQGRFRFEVRGSFAQQGVAMEREFLRTADDLFLTGWVKARGAFVKGDLQGDVYAVTYMQRWLQENHFSETAESVAVTHENFGLQDDDLPKRTLRAVKDWRKHYTKRDQFKVANMTRQVDLLKARAEGQVADRRENSRPAEFNYQLQTF